MKLQLQLKQTLPTLPNKCLVEYISNYALKKRKKIDLDSNKTVAITARCSEK